MPREATLRFEKLLGLGLCDSLLLPFLRLGELSRLECTCHRSRMVLLAGPSWERCARREVLPDFCIPSASAASRQDIREVVTRLPAAGIAVDTPRPMELRSFGAARSIATAIARAQGAQARHLAQHGGGFAEIVVATFRLKNGDGDGMPTQADTTASTSHVGSCHVAVVVPGGALKVWELTLTWQASTAFVSAQCLVSDESSVDDLGLLLDLQSVSEDVTLRLHDVHLDAESDWVQGRGLVLSTSKHRGSQATLADGLVCVLLLRDVRRVDSGEKLAPIAHAMHLDAPHHSAYVGRSWGH